MNAPWPLQVEEHDADMSTSPRTCPIIKNNNIHEQRAQHCPSCTTSHWPAATTVLSVVLVLLCLVFLNRSNHFTAGVAFTQSCTVHSEWCV